MKTNTLKTALAVGLTALLAGSAAAQESTASAPVGYETLTINAGFNYLGLRLHEAPVASGVSVGEAAGAVVSVATGAVNNLATGQTYIFEVTSGDAAGATVLIDSFDAAANTITLSDDISGDFADGSGFTIRPSATLATVFGENNSAGLAAGLGGPANADQVWVQGSDGAFEKYYFDNEDFNNFSPAWVLVSDGVTVVDPSTVEIIYTDGIIILGAGAEKPFVVSGSVKLTDTSYSVGDGFNYLSSVSPVGATLETMFGAENSANLSAGLGGPANADQVWIPSAGGFTKYYFDNEDFNNFETEWVLVSDGQTVVDPSTVSLEDASGLIILNAGGNQQVASAVPSIYRDL